MKCHEFGATSPVTCHEGGDATPLKALCGIRVSTILPQHGRRIPRQEAYYGLLGHPRPCCAYPHDGRLYWSAPSLFQCSVRLPWYPAKVCRGCTRRGVTCPFCPPRLLGTARPVPYRTTDPVGVLPDTELLEVRYAATKKADDSGWETPAWFSEDKPVKHDSPTRPGRERHGSIPELVRSCLAAGSYTAGRVRPLGTTRCCLWLTHHARAPCVPLLGDHLGILLKPSPPGSARALSLRPHVSQPPTL